MYHVLFDLGNVIINFDHRVISQALAKCVPADERTDSLEDDIHTFIFGNSGQSSPNVHLDRGTMSIDELHRNLVRRFSLDVENNVFRAIWSSIFADSLNVNTIQCLNELRGHGFNVAICSNTNPAHWEPLLKQHAELNDICSSVTCFLSYEMGKQKADAGFFDSVMEFTKAPPAHHLLIDDLDENCRSAESAGMHAVWFRPNDPGESINQIHAFVTDRDWVRGVT